MHSSNSTHSFLSQVEWSKVEQTGKLRGESTAHCRHTHTVYKWTFCLQLKVTLFIQRTVVLALRSSEIRFCTLHFKPPHHHITSHHHVLVIGTTCVSVSSSVYTLMRRARLHGVVAHSHPWHPVAAVMLFNSYTTIRSQLPCFTPAQVWCDAVCQGSDRHVLTCLLQVQGVR
jgi:hypothetical protein